MKFLFKNIKQWVANNWHTPCLLCRGPSLKLVCEQCVCFLPKFTAGCQCCGFPVLHPLSYYCDVCFFKPPYFDQVHALFHYLWPVKHWVLNLKFQHKLEIAYYFGQLMAERFQFVIAPDIIVPVPLHPDRQKDRGFNQSIELAKPLAKALLLPLSINLARRIKITTRQSSTPLKTRYSNVEDAFVIDGDVAGKSILIIDDVMTTGATVNALSLALKKAGAVFVQIGCLCRSC